MPRSWGKRGSTLGPVTTSNDHRGPRLAPRCIKMDPRWLRGGVRSPPPLRTPPPSSMEGSRRRRPLRVGSHPGARAASSGPSSRPGPGSWVGDRASPGSLRRADRPSAPDRHRPEWPRAAVRQRATAPPVQLVIGHDVAEEGQPRAGSGRLVDAVDPRSALLVQRRESLVAEVATAPAQDPQERPSPKVDADRGQVVVQPCGPAE